MTAPAKPRRRARRTAIAVVALVVLGVLAYLVYLTVPDQRTAFLVDTSRSRVDIGAVAASVGSAARNAGDGDAVSLRRFGGECGAADNTSELVGSGTGRGAEIASAARGLSAAGKPTLQSGVLAAIDDFSGIYPFRGLTRNRIVVVTSHGTDGCTSDQQAVMRAVRERVAAAGLTLECRFVGFQVPEGQQDDLHALARACGAPEPRFVRTVEELDVALRELVVPGLGRAEPVQVPVDTPKPKPEHEFTVALMTGWGVEVTGTPGTCRAETGGRMLCRFKLAEGAHVRLVAEITGPDPNPLRRDVPGYRPANTPYWYGCDEGPRSRTCTVTMDRDRLSKARPKSGGTPSTSMAACVTTSDPAAGALAMACAALTGSEPPPMTGG